jgi:hypothetical protein
MHGGWCNCYYLFTHLQARTLIPAATVCCSAVPETVLLTWCRSAMEAQHEFWAREISCAYYFSFV